MKKPLVWKRALDWDPILFGIQEAMLFFLESGCYIGAFFCRGLDTTTNIVVPYPYHSYNVRNLTHIN